MDHRVAESVFGVRFSGFGSHVSDVCFPSPGFALIGFLNELDSSCGCTMFEVDNCAVLGFPCLANQEEVDEFCLMRKTADEYSNTGLRSYDRI